MVSAPEKPLLVDPLADLAVCADCGRVCSARWQYKPESGPGMRLPFMIFCDYRCAARYPKKQGITRKARIKRSQTVLGKRYPVRIMLVCGDCADTAPKAESRRCFDCGLTMCEGCQAIHRRKGHRIT